MGEKQSQENKLCVWQKTVALQYYPGSGEKPETFTWNLSVLLTLLQSFGDS